MGSASARGALVPLSALLCLHCRTWPMPIQPPHQEAGALTVLFTPCPGFLSLFPPPWCLIAHPSSAFLISSSHQCGRQVCKERGWPSSAFRTRRTPWAFLCPKPAVLRPAPAICLSVCLVCAGSQGSGTIFPVLLLLTLQHSALSPQNTDTE